MNILFLTLKKAGQQFPGGTEKITGVLMECFTKDGNNCINGYIQENDYELYPGVKGIRLPSDSYNFGQELKNIFEREKIDIIINQQMPSQVEVIRKTIEASTQNSKVFYCAHTAPGAEFIPINLKIIIQQIKNNHKRFPNLIKLLLLPFYKKIYEKKLRKEYRKIYKNSNKVVLLSSGYKKDWLEIAKLEDSDEKIKAIPNCLTMPDFFEIQNYRLKKKEVLVVARFDEPLKNLSEVIKIWEIIENSKTFTDWQLIMVGTGPYEKYYKKMIEKASLQRIKIEKSSSPQSFYQRASIFLMTSRKEGFGLTLNEAKQNGVVPIVYDSFASLRDIIHDETDGIIVNNRDRKSFVSKLKNLMNKEAKRKEMAQNGIKDSKRFSPEKIKADWYQLFQED